MTDKDIIGRVPSEPGSREPSPQAVSAASGFDPSRGRPSFEKCAETLAGYIVEGKYRPSDANALQREHGYDEYKLAARAREIAAADPARFSDLSHEYQVVAEILEYFDSYRLATWAPIAAIIRRERRDSDGSRNGRDAQRLDGEAATARAEGIAHPLSPKDLSHDE